MNVTNAEHLNAAQVQEFAKDVMAAASLGIQIQKGKVNAHTGALVFYGHNVNQVIVIPQEHVALFRNAFQTIEKNSIASTMRRTDLSIEAKVFHSEKISALTGRVLACIPPEAFPSANRARQSRPQPAQAQANIAQPTVDRQLPEANLMRNERAPESNAPERLAYLRGGKGVALANTLDDLGASVQANRQATETHTAAANQARLSTVTAQPGQAPMGGARSADHFNAAAGVRSITYPQYDVVGRGFPGDGTDNFNGMLRLLYMSDRLSSSTGFARVGYDAGSADFLTRANYPDSAFSTGGVSKSSSPHPPKLKDLDFAVVDQIGLGERQCDRPHTPMINIVEQEMLTFMQKNENQLAKGPTCFKFDYTPKMKVNDEYVTTGMGHTFLVTVEKDVHGEFHITLLDSLGGGNSYKQNDTINGVKKALERSGHVVHTHQIKEQNNAMACGVHVQANLALIKEGVDRGGYSVYKAADKHEFGKRSDKQIEQLHAGLKQKAAEYYRNQALSSPANREFMFKTAIQNMIDNARASRSSKDAAYAKKFIENLQAMPEFIDFCKEKVRAGDRDMQKIVSDYRIPMR